MSLLDTVRSAVKTADTVTKALQATVTYKKAVLITTDGYGSYDYPSSVQLLAIVDWTRKQLRTQTGVLSLSRASVMFLDIDALVSATGGQGIDDHDQIILPDGTTGPILDMSGFIDAGTGHPVATEVFLG